MKRKLLSLFASACFAFTAFAQTPYELVNPFIGTGGHGHTYPGATTPHGAVQLSPDTRRGNWDACSGYHYSDNSILGFSHTHLSGTGCADLGDFLIAPYFNKSMTFKHENEMAQPGYYSVTLDDGTFCELTATTYCGMHHYKYPEGTQNIKLKLDLGQVLDNGGYAKACEADVTGPNEICGMRTTHSWVNDRTIYFVIRFDRGLSTTQVYGDYSASRLNEQKVEKAMEINFYGQKELTFKVAVSTTSIAEAKKNMEHDIKGFNFDNVRANARLTWENELGCIKVAGGTQEQRVNFYTALYHSLVVPNIISDAYDKQKVYSTFSNWDTFRAWNPLMTLIDRELVSDMINSMLLHYDKHGALPIWGLQGLETNCMIGYHSASIIWDAYQKGIKFDAEKALTALLESSKKYGRGIENYSQYGFFASDRTRESVSETLEIAYDDWCIAMLAYSLGRQDIYKTYYNRSQNYINIFDGESRFFRGRKLNGNVEDGFNCYRQTKDYTEATPWQYRFFVPHDVNGMVQLFGGKEKCLAALDSLFESPSKVEGGVDDISGLIGQYAHGNEPSHHMAFLYSYLGKPEKTDYYVHKILNEMYKNTPDGIVGNEDCGQMSAWYILASMGLYPMCPGNGSWVPCKPIFDFVSINGISLADYQLPAYKYDESQWRNVVSIPYCNRDITKLGKKGKVELGSATDGAEIRYTLNGKVPTQSSKLYKKAFRPKGKVLMIRAFKNGYAPSPVKIVNLQ